MSERPFPSQILDIEVTPFVRHVNESSYKVFGGDYLPRLQDARETAFDELSDILGLPKVPESYLRQYYTRTNDERETSRRFHNTLQRKFAAKAMRDELLESPLKLSEARYDDAYRRTDRLARAARRAIERNHNRTCQSRR